METAQEFILKKLKALYNHVDGIKIRYEHRKYMSTHLIEILPLSIFENHDFILMEMKIQDEFEAKFPKEDILFISEESLCEIGAEEQFKIGYMEWTKNSPKEPGKYIVETKTMMGNSHRLESNWNGKSWSFTNQTFVRYLKE